MNPDRSDFIRVIRGQRNVRHRINAPSNCEARSGASQRLAVKPLHLKSALLAQIRQLCKMRW